jgi:hypothetical protein
LTQVLSKGAINLGDRTVRTAADAGGVLNAANSADARVMLRAQLLATMLNLQNGSSSMNLGVDIRLTVQAAVQFLVSNSAPVTESSRNRLAAIALKDRLDAYNNSKGPGCR